MKQLLLTLVLVVVADGLISEFLLGRGLGREGNPLLMGVVDSQYFLAAKLAGGLLAALALWHSYKTRPRAAWSIAVVAVAVYAAIIFWNVAVFFITRS